MDETERLVALIPRLRRYARALVGDQAGADDLVQDTLERAFSRLHFYRPVSDLRAWLFTIPLGTVMSRLARAREKVRRAVFGRAQLKVVN